MATKKDVFKSLENIMHPTINFSLVKLGIIKDVIVEDDNAKVIFALPFANIPIIHDLIFLVSEPIMNLYLSFEYETVMMTEQEKAKFMQLEAEGWKGLD